MIRRHCFLILFVLTCVAQAAAAPIKVEITPSGQMMRDGKPYFIKGAGGSDHLEELAKRGGNSVRTWGVDGLKEILDQAEKLHMTVSAGVWLESEASYFSYKNPEQCQTQLTKLLEVVRAHKDHPALLTWGLGNEAEGDGGLDEYWKQLEKLAQAVHKLDPAHPTFTAVAGLSEKKAQGLNQHTPSLDFIGINTYGALPHLRETTLKNGWKRPWAVTEFGTRGFWEIGKTPFGAPLEPMPMDKCSSIKSAYQKAIQPGAPCIGSYAFLWGQKDEATSTWFSLLTKTGFTTPPVDTLQELWSGKAPENAAPLLSKLESTARNQELAAGTTFSAVATATDKENDTLTWSWIVKEECSGRRDSNGRPLSPKSKPKAILEAQGDHVKVAAPAEPGVYRLYVEVGDGHGHADTTNFAFRVK